MRGIVSSAPSRNWISWFPIPLRGLGRGRERSRSLRWIRTAPEEFTPTGRSSKSFDMQSRPISYVNVWICSSLLAACAASPTPPPASLPDDFYFEVVGSPVSIITEYRITGDGVLKRTVTSFSRGDPRTSTKQRVITLQGWQRFQQKIAPLRIERWKHLYSPPGLTKDGYNWQLRWVAGRKRIDSAGDNAAPDLKNPSKTDSDSCSSESNPVYILSDALDDLWKHSKR